MAALRWLTQGVLTAAVVPVGRPGAVAGVFLCVAAAQFLNALASPCSDAIIPRLAGHSQIARINRVYAVAQASSVFIAPLIGSAILLVASPDTLLLIDAGTFVFGAGAAGSIVLMPRDSEQPPEQAQSDGALRGLAFALLDPVLRMLLATFFAGALVVTTLQAVLVAAAAQRLGGADQVGGLYAAAGVGGIIGSLLVRRWRPRSVLRRIFAAAGVVEVGALGLFALVPVVTVAITLLVASTTAATLGETWGTIDLQERVPAAVLGRVDGATQTALYGGMLAGAVLALGLSRVVAWQVTMATVSAVGLGVIALGALPARVSPTELGGSLIPSH